MQRDRYRDNDHIKSSTPTCLPGVHRKGIILRVEANDEHVVPGGGCLLSVRKSTPSRQSREGVQ